MKKKHDRKSESSEALMATKLNVPISRNDKKLEPLMEVQFSLVKHFRHIYFTYFFFLSFRRWAHWSGKENGKFK